MWAPNWAAPRHRKRVSPRRPDLRAPLRFQPPLQRTPTPRPTESRRGLRGLRWRPRRSPGRRLRLRRLPAAASAEAAVQNGHRHAPAALSATQMASSFQRMEPKTIPPPRHPSRRCPPAEEPRRHRSLPGFFSTHSASRGRLASRDRLASRGRMASLLRGFCRQWSSTMSARTPASSTIPFSDVPAPRSCLRCRWQPPLLRLQHFVRLLWLEGPLGETAARHRRPNSAWAFASPR
mmetsp:Transcript_39060/g.112225  ORF Transcript_39060/g.112225 Transcript_39060/m.112225 type:complete len:235 (+) Transcript_39060:765-1469(+)